MPVNKDKEHVDSRSKTKRVSELENHVGELERVMEDLQASEARYH